ncbi:hypothetical protein pdam_00009465 [Pocillopora damicornis]|uniref:long-chain-fatty-acid--CoA ligase n=1 Tax=Pocillopora damicornis TaxID=46731 RepID=A0A3M6TGT9_POCDA|nr:hypothetical protein pdam_00009465 [Pocillopora damicornis]
MADNAAEAALKYLRDPAIAAGLGAMAVASMYYLTSRPTPQPCPVDPTKQSYELPDGDYARMNSLTTELVEKLFEDVSTSHEAFLRGKRLSGDKPCLGYRSSPGGPYAWLTYNEVDLEMMLGSKMVTVVCDESKIKVLLEQSDKCPKLKNIVKIGSSVTDEEKEAGEKVGIKITCFRELEPPKPEDLAVVCYTSGTTGNAKGAMITHKNAIAMLSGLVYLVQECGILISSEDVHISYLPLAHMYERLAQVIKQASSSAVKSFLFNLAMRFKKAELERNIVRNDSIWDYLVFKKIQNSLGGRVRFVISGSAPLRDDVMIFLRCALGCQVFEGYGQTETTAAATLQMIGDQTYGHVGPPLPCNKIKLVDVPEMEYYAKEGKGEVCFYGPNVFKGYLYDEDKTKEAIDEDGWLHSGDVGEWQPNGTLKVIDRKKHIFKLSQGEYIAPEKVEKVYTQCSMVHQVYVHGDSKKSCLVAVVVPEKDPVEKWAEKNGVDGDMDSFCANEVKAIFLTPEIFTTENGLLTPTLKFKRPALKKHFLQTFEDLYATVPE